MARIGKIEIPNIFDVVIAVVLVMVIVQAISLILTQLFGLETLKLGPGLLIMLVGLVFVVMARIAKDYNVGYQFTRSNFLMMIIVIAVVILAYIFLPQMVPDMFSVAVSDLRWFFG